MFVSPKNRTPIGMNCPPFLNLSGAHPLVMGKAARIFVGDLKVLPWKGTNISDLATRF